MNVGNSKPVCKTMPRAGCFASPRPERFLETKRGITPNPDPIAILRGFWRPSGAHSRAQVTQEQPRRQDRGRPCAILGAGVLAEAVAMAGSTKKFLQATTTNPAEWTQEHGRARTSPEDSSASDRRRHEQHGGPTRKSTFVYQTLALDTSVTPTCLLRRSLELGRVQQKMLPTTARPRCCCNRMFTLVFLRGSFRCTATHSPAECRRGR